MRRVRGAAMAAVVMSLLVASASPALADTTPVALTSTGMVDGQHVGRLGIHPAWTGDATAVEVQIGSRVKSYAPEVAARGIHPTFLMAELNTYVAVTVRVRGAGDDSAEATTRIYVDFMPPQDVVITPPTQTVVHGMVTVALTDVPDDLASAVVLNGGLDGREIARLTAAPWEITVDAATLVNGRVWFELTDTAGNEAAIVRTLVPDYAGPRVTPWVTSYPIIVPEGVHRFDVSVTDRSPVDHVEFWIGGAYVSTGTSLTYDFGRTSRTVTVETRAWDSWGNESVSSFPVTVDASAPVVTGMTPGNNGLVRGSRIASTVTATDVAGIGYATLDGAATDFSAPYAGSIPAGKDGRHPVKWTLVDLYGHTSSITRYVTVDNTKPTLSITSAPKNKAKVSGTVKIGASASDKNGVNRVELLINGKLVAKDVTAGYSFSINSKSYGKTIKMQLRAYDRAGNVTYTTTRTWHR